ncbi:hypothetical protein GCM10010988_38800 [Cnuibacter physcomitrellae]|nr:hypothetical protein GCM10010988_38800 [Cnuibacter physcomitrellae]
MGAIPVDFRHERHDVLGIDPHPGTAGRAVPVWQRDEARHRPHCAGAGTIVAILTHSGRLRREKWN